MNISQDYLVYAKKVSAVGDQITKISNELINISTDEKAEKKLKNDYNVLLKAVGGYRECKTALANIIPPNGLQGSHKELNNALQMFIDGTEFMCNSIDIGKLTLNKDQMRDGLLLQKQGEKEVVRISKEIIKQLG